MLKRIAVMLLLLVGAVSALQAYTNTYAVIVGVADYKYLGPRDDLRYTINDAISFASFLKSKKGGSVPASNIVMLVDSQATKANIVAKSKELFSKAKKDDRVIFYFTGHGIKGCFAPYDADGSDARFLYFDEIKAIFRCAKCNTKLLFADACQSGSMKLEQMAKSNKKSSKQTETANMNIAVMMACKSNEYSAELHQLRQGLFTYYLIEGLSGQANADGNRYITIQELYYYVYHKVQDKAKELHHTQTPELFGKFDLRLIVAKV